MPNFKNLDDLKMSLHFLTSGEMPTPFPSPLDFEGCVSVWSSVRVSDLESDISDFTDSWRSRRRAGDRDLGVVRGLSS